MKKFVVFNSKGGSGKTSISINLAGVLTKFFGKKVLLIDADTSGNASGSIARVEEPVVPFANLLVEYALNPNTIGSIKDAICKTAFPNLDIIPCIDTDKFTKAAQLSYADKDNGEFYFQDFFEELNEDNYYDYVILDAGAGNATMNPLAKNALVASDFVLIPFFADKYNLEGLSEIIATVQSVKKRNNPRLEILGTFISRYDKNASLSKFAAEESKEAIGAIYMDTPIRESNYIANAVTEYKPVCYYRPTAAVVEDYIDLATEIIRRLEAK